MRGLRLALVGDPVEHSRSPRIHRAALDQAGLEGEYRAIRADEEALDGILEDLRSGELDGLNVTMPLKSAATERADVLTDLARRARSVNTLRARDGRIEAHSTDAVAFAEIFTGEVLTGGSCALVLGSGGSARAALAVIDRLPVYVSARNRRAAEALASDPGAAGVVPWGSGVEDAVVVNATPIGMRGEQLPAEVISVASGLIDLPYGEAPTPGVLTARSVGLPHVDGIEFLTRQAAASFQWWTGETVDFRVLIGAARNV